MPAWLRGRAGLQAGMRVRVRVRVHACVCACVRVHMRTVRRRQCACVHSCARVRANVCFPHIACIRTQLCMCVRTHPQVYIASPAIAAECGIAVSRSGVRAVLAWSQCVRVRALCVRACARACARARVGACLQLVFTRAHERVRGRWRRGLSRLALCSRPFAHYCLRFVPCCCRR